MNNGDDSQGSQAGLSVRSCSLNLRLTPTATGRLALSAEGPVPARAIPALSERMILLLGKLFGDGFTRDYISGFALLSRMIEGVKVRLLSPETFRADRRAISSIILHRSRALSARLSMHAPDRFPADRPLVRAVPLRPGLQRFVWEARLLGEVGVVFGNPGEPSPSALRVEELWDLMLSRIPQLASIASTFERAPLPHASGKLTRDLPVASCSSSEKGPGEEAADREIDEILELVEVPPPDAELERRLAEIRLPRPRWESLRNLYTQAGRIAVTRALTG